MNFSSLGKSNYRFHTNYKIRSDLREGYKILHDELMNKFRGYFSCKYIPSEKSAESLYRNLFLPHLKNQVGNLLQHQEDLIVNCLDDISKEVGKNLEESGIKNISCQFSLPNNLFSNALSKFDFFINDGKKTHSLRKGTGIQAATTLACFKWITEQENRSNKKVIWLIEEPESYLHPGLYDSCNKIINKLSEISTVFITTHAIGFVPQEPKKTIATAITEQGTSCHGFETYAEATSSIRKALGLRFSDFYNLSEFNVFVEGKTDKIVLEWALRLIQPKGKSNAFNFLRSATIVDYGGVSKLKEFLKSTYIFMGKERAIVILLDGDDASTKVTSDLTNYFRGKINFRSNEEYFLLPNRLPIEGIFPEDWLIELSKVHEGWISIERDIKNKIISMKIDDSKKMNIVNWLMKRGDEEFKNSGHYAWAAELIAVLNALDSGLSRKFEEIKEYKN